MIVTCITLVQLLSMLLSGAWGNAASGAQTSLDLRFVGTVPALQRAINDGVKHVVVTEHLSAISAQLELERNGVSLDSAIGSIQRDTKSIVGSCEQPPDQSPAVAQLPLNEVLPPNACVIEVEEDFMELPLRQGRGATELWLHNFYIITQTPRITPNNSATTILHKDGALYITSTVFQGRDYWNRAIDLSTSDGGTPLLFVDDSSFVDFRRDHAAAIRGNANTTITVQNSAFKRLTITPMQKPAEDPIKWARVFGSAIGLFENALLWIQDVTVEEQIVLAAPAGSKVFTFESAPLEENTVGGGQIYSQPALEVWDHSLNKTVSSQPPNSRPNRFLSGGSILQGIIAEQELLVEQATVSRSTPTSPPGTSTQDPTVTSDTLAKLNGNSDSDGHSSSILVVVVIVVVCLALLVVVLVAVLLLCRKRRNKQSEAASASMIRSAGHHEESAVKGYQRFETGSELAGLDTRHSNLSSYSHSTREKVGYPHHSGSIDRGLAPSERTGGERNMAPLTPGSYDIQHPPPNSYGKKSATQHKVRQGSDASGGSQLHRHNSQQSSVSEASAWGKLFGTGRNTGHHDSIAATTFDVTYHAEGLPTPSHPGQILSKDLLNSALDQATHNEDLFLGRFELLGNLERREGGQGVVQFARECATGAGVAIKFFWNRNSFECEERLYSNQSLRGLMPAIALIENNASGAAMTPEGWLYPPFIVVERGESLDEWQLRIQPDFPTIVQMLLHMTERVDRLHKVGIAHRDLKPGNILWRPAQHSWTLIDFGCAAEIGIQARLTFSPVYAPPETLQAFHNGATTIVADAAVDIWAIGVMTFELVTHKRAFNCFTWPKFDVILAALGKRAYDWESEVGTFKTVPELRILAKVVHACLQRDPVKRPSSQELLQMLNSLYDRRTTIEGAMETQPSN